MYKCHPISPCHPSLWLLSITLPSLQPYKANICIVCFGYIDLTVISYIPAKFVWQTKKQQKKHVSDLIYTLL